MDRAKRAFNQVLPRASSSTCSGINFVTDSMTHPPLRRLFTAGVRTFLDPTA